MLVRGFCTLFAVGIVAVSSSLAGVAQGATLSLVSAPGARLDLRIYNYPYANLQQMSVDLSSRLGGSLALEPLGSFHAVGLEVFLEGDPIVITSTIPGMALPFTFRVDEVTWTAPIATQPLVPLNIVAGETVGFFTTSASSWAGSLKTAGLEPTAFTDQDAVLEPGYPLVTPFPVRVVSPNEVIFGSDATRGIAQTVVEGVWFGGTTTVYRVSATLTIQELVFVPEPAPAPLVGAAVALLIPVIRAWSRSGQKRTNVAMKGPRS